MKVDLVVRVNAPKDAVWRIVSDIENAEHIVSGIDRVEVLEKPASGLSGLKWRETRTLFGKTAVETMWITEAVEGSHYRTEARNHGAVYRSRVYVEEYGESGTCLGMTFQAEAHTFAAKLASLLLAPLMKGATRKALLQDLEDIKAASESAGGD
ncbi:MAG: SRPBCC family protein [Gemmatimonadota bacterium]